MTRSFGSLSAAPGCTRTGATFGKNIRLILLGPVTLRFMLGLSRRGMNLATGSLETTKADLMAPITAFGEYRNMIPSGHTPGAKSGMKP
jgi:hypothetical protein